MRVKFEVDVATIHKIKKQLLQWANQFEEVIWLDSNSYPEIQNKYQAILAVDADRIFTTDSYDGLTELKEYRKTNKDWLFGYLSYNAGSSRRQKINQKSDLLQFSKLSFFHPRKIFFLKNDGIELQYISDLESEIKTDWKAINAIEVQDDTQNKLNLKINSRLSKNEYLEKVKLLKAYINKGEITEINFCQEFYTQASSQNPLEIYQHLNEISKTPFAAYLRMGDKYAICASPERYLSHTDGKIMSQPIKGTAKRKESLKEDREARYALEKDEKEILENSRTTEMVVDELYSIAEEGSVQVTELAKVYTFEQVHQLISTVVCQLHP